jgi:2-methylcitrate dehydratase PrpD
MTATTRLAEFVVKTSLRDCPDAVLAQTRRAALDTIGVTLAGASEPVAAAVRAVARAEGGLPLCTVVGTALRTSPGWAALANGTAGHAHDFDDTNFALMGHPSVPLLATALACAEAETADGAALAVAYVIGFEIDAALGIALNPDHYTRGWHATSSIGTLGCAAAAARLLGLDVDQTRHALGIAASMASGLKENFGSMTKPFHAGHAARSGVTAAQLAREGQTASDGALDGRQGYVAAFSGATQPDDLLGRALDRLGTRWELTGSGIAVKPYPSCALTHSAIDALLELRARHRLDPAKVAAVEVGVNAVVPDVLRHTRPSNGLERKFSMQFCAAAALARGAVGLADFAEGPVRDAATRELMERVTMVVDRALPRGLDQHAWSRVTVRLADGTTLESTPRGASGHPATPLSDAELTAKFLGCATPVLGADAAAGVAEQIMRLEEIPDVRALTSRLVAERE